MRNSRGTSLVELMVAVVILTIGVVGVFGAFRSINMAIHVARSQTLATNLAQEEIETLKDMTYYELMVTSSPVLSSTLNPPVYPAFNYDAASYPPQTYTIGGVTLTRYTYVQMVAVGVNGAISAAPPDPDTGMKQITENVVWMNGGVPHVWTLTNVLENPNVNPQDSSISGFSYSTMNVILPGMSVSVDQYPEYNTTTDIHGAYSFKVYHGTYSVSMSSPGFVSWNSGTVDVPRGGNTVVTSSMVAVASATLVSSVWYNTNLVISQVVSSTWTNGVETAGNCSSGWLNAAGTPTFEQEYVELFNPTTAQVNLASPASVPLITITYGGNYKKHGGTGWYECTPSLIYVSTFAPAQGYYLIANAPMISAGGVSIMADAYYGPTQCANGSIGASWAPPGCEGLLPASGYAGLVWLSSAGTLATPIDSVGWLSNANVSPNSCNQCSNVVCNGTCIPLAGLSSGDQVIRVSSPSWTFSPGDEMTYGRAYNSGNNANDFYYNLSYPTLGLAGQPYGFIPPSNHFSTVPVISGIPSTGAFVSASDYNSGSTTTFTAYISSGFYYNPITSTWVNRLLPYAPFTLPGVALGSWVVDVALSSGGVVYFNEYSSATASVQAAAAPMPTWSTYPTWPALGQFQTVLTTSTLNGFIKGQVSDSYGNSVPGITVQCAGNSKTTDANGAFFMVVSSGPSNMVVNPNNVNLMYIQQIVPVTINSGQLLTQNVALSQGGTLQGYTTTGTTPLPNVTVAALFGGNQMGTAVSNASGIFSIKNLPTSSTAPYVYSVQPQTDVDAQSSPASQNVTMESTGTVFVGTFTVSGNMGNITGSVTNTALVPIQPITTGVLILASTSTLPSTPPAIYGASAPALGSPIYATSSRSDGSYTLQVRGSTLAAYNIMAYLPTLTGSTGVTTSNKSYSGVSVTAGGTITKNITFP